MRAILLSLPSLLLLLLCSIITPGGAWGQTLINLPTGGQVRGYVNEVPATPTHPSYSSLTWRGVKFGEANRWMHSQAFSWKGVREALYDGPGCSQICHLPPNTCPEDVSEDCLYLNVYAPRDATPSSRLPVLFYIHGGNFYQGHAGGLLYDGSFIANRTRTIVVTTNYRLGILGFLHNSKLEGNYGLHDQRLALAWVSKNIAAFGGDPSAVTIAGQSAGAVSVTLHMISPKSQPFFRSAIILSDPFSLNLRTAENWQLASDVFCESVGCEVDDIDCLRALNREFLAEKEAELRQNLLISVNDPLSAFMPFTPVVGGHEFPEQPLTVLQRGNLAKNIPVMIGATSEEIYVFVYEAFGQPLPLWKYDVLLAVVFGVDNLLPLLARYPVDETKEDFRDDASVLAGDGIFICPTRNVSDVLSQGQPRTYYYIYDHLMSFGEEGWGPDFQQCWDRVCHGAELPFFFHSGTPDFFNFTQEEEILSQQIVDSVTNFVRTGNPNSGANIGFDWKPYDQNQRLTTVFSVNPPTHQQNDWREEYCTFWDTEIGYDF